MRPATTALALVALVAAPALAQPSYWPSTISRRSNGNSECHGPTCSMNNDAIKTSTINRRTTNDQNTAQVPESEAPGAPPSPPTTYSPPAQDPAEQPVNGAAPVQTPESEVPPKVSSPTTATPHVPPPITATHPPMGQHPPKPLVKGTGVPRGAFEIELKLMEWAGHRLFELFFGLHIGQFQVFWDV